MVIRIWWLLVRASERLLVRDVWLRGRCVMFGRGGHRSAKTTYLVSTISWRSKV